MRTEPLLMPGAVVIGCGLIGLGLYLGLRPVATAPVAGVPAAETATSPVAPGAPLPRGDAPTPAVSSPAASSAAARALVEQAVNEALLAEKKATFVPRCWQPALAREPQPGSSRYIFELTIDATGREVARGIGEIRGESRGDVSQCLRGLPMSLQITPPPATSMGFSLELTFP